MAACLTTAAWTPSWTPLTLRTTSRGRAGLRAGWASPTSVTTPASRPQTLSSMPSRSRRTASARTTSPLRRSPATTTLYTRLSTRSSSQDMATPTWCRMARITRSLDRFPSFMVTVIIITMVTLCPVPAGGKFSRGMPRTGTGCIGGSTATTTTAMATTRQMTGRRSSPPTTTRWGTRPSWTIPWGGQPARRAWQCRGRGTSWRSSRWTTTTEGSGPATGRARRPILRERLSGQTLWTRCGTGRTRWIGTGARARRGSTARTVMTQCPPSVTRTAPPTCPGPTVTGDQRRIMSAVAGTTAVSRTTPPTTSTSMTRGRLTWGQTWRMLSSIMRKGVRMTGMTGGNLIASVVKLLRVMKSHSTDKEY